MIRAISASAPTSLLTGIHGDNPSQVYNELCKLADKVITHFESESRPLPDPKVRPMKELV